VRAYTTPLWASDVSLRTSPLIIGAWPVPTLRPGLVNRLFSSDADHFLCRHRRKLQGTLYSILYPATMSPRKIGRTVQHVQTHSVRELGPLSAIGICYQVIHPVIELWAPSKDV